MSANHLRLPFPTNPDWDQRERQAAVLAARIAHDALGAYLLHNQQRLTQMERKAAMRPLIANWITAITDLYAEWDTSREGEEE